MFTNGALNQLKSRGFEVLYFEYSTVIKAFAESGLDASFDEDTSAADFDNKIKMWEAFDDKESVIDKLINLNKNKVDTFFKALKKSVDRYITEIRILPLYGNQIILGSIKDAIDFLNSKDIDKSKDSEFIRFEIKIVYSNSDKIEASFSNSDNAKKFLSIYENPSLKIK